MRLKAVAKGGHKGWIGARMLNSLTPAYAATDEMPMKKLHSKTRVIGDLSSLEMRASATAKMAAPTLRF
jgi:hypothetical protein